MAKKNGKTQAPVEAQVENVAVTEEQNSKKKDNGVYLNGIYNNDKNIKDKTANNGYVFKREVRIPMETPQGVVFGYTDVEPNQVFKQPKNPDSDYRNVRLGDPDETRKVRIMNPPEVGGYVTTTMLNRDIAESYEKARAANKAKNAEKNAKEVPVVESPQTEADSADYGCEC